MGNIFIYIQYTILIISIIRMAYYFVKAMSQDDSFAYQGMLINLLFSAAIIVLIHLVQLTKEEIDLSTHIVAVLFDLIGCIYFGFFYVNKAEKDYNKYFDLKYAKSFLEFYEIDVDSFKKKSYEEQLEIINNAYIVNCDSGMVEYMIDKEDEGDLKDTLDILEPLLNKGVNI